MGSGGQSVMTTGAFMMLLLSADSWGIQLPTTRTGQYNAVHCVGACTFFVTQPPTISQSMYAHVCMCIIMVHVNMCPCSNSPLT